VSAAGRFSAVRAALRPMASASMCTVVRAGENSAPCDGAETGRHTLRTATGPVQLRAAPDRPHITAHGGDLAYVTLTLTDPDGTLHTAADRPVTVEVSGAGVLSGFGSADPSTEDRFDATERRTYEGRALAVHRPTGRPGRIRLVASAPGCAPVEVVVTVE
jgi:beta-galactosidase